MKAPQSYTVMCEKSWLCQNKVLKLKTLVTDTEGSLPVMLVGQSTPQRPVPL